MAEETKKDRPDHRCAAMARMERNWKIVNDLTDGTIALRCAEYLPQRKLEGDDRWEERKRGAMLVNVFDDTVSGCVGLVFRDEPTLGEDVSPIIKKQWENVDLAGTHWTVFFKDAFDIAVRNGHCAVLTENEPKLGNDADASQDNRRPYLVKYSPEQIFNPFTIQIGGQTILEQITFKETKMEREGEYCEKEVTRYRTFKRVQMIDEDGNESVDVLWKVEEEQGEEGKKAFVVIGEGSTGLSEIPVRVIYGHKVREYESKPPFIGIAELNLIHWEKTSDYNQNIKANQYNLLKRIGAGTEADAGIGSYGMIDLPIGGDVEFVSPNANVIELAGKDLMDLEKRMQTMGVSVLLDESGGNKTAAEVNVEHGKRTSKLSSMVHSEKDCIEGCLFFFGDYQNIKETGSVTIGADIDALVITDAQLQLLLQAVEGGNFSRLTFLQILGQHLPVPEDFDATKENDELQNIEETQMKDVVNPSLNGKQKTKTETTRQIA